MLIDEEQIIHNLGPQLVELAARVSSLTPDSRIRIDFTTPAVLPEHEVGVGFVTMRHVIDALAQACHGKFPLILVGQRSDRHGDRITTSMMVKRPAEPVAEDYVGGAE